MAGLMNIVAEHGRLAVLLLFFVMFVGFALWAYAPRNKSKMERCGEIPLKNGD